MKKFEGAFQYKLIYIMTIPDGKHDGLLKIGESTLDSTLSPDKLTPDCDELNEAAHKRIKQYTQAALTDYVLLHTELALRTVKRGESTTLESFGDGAVHSVLVRSGYESKKHSETGRNSDWFELNLQTAMNAVIAYKEGRNVLSPSEKVSQPQNAGKEVFRKIDLRQEQKEAVEKTLYTFKKNDRMLWNCKMRFGKTVSAYELIRRAGYQKSIVVTHRPVVEEGWDKDHDAIFGEGSDHLFVTKENNGGVDEYDQAIDADNDQTLRTYDRLQKYFTYFTSMQDLRGSKCVGGKFDKNRAVFEMDWDLIIYDEAHEGTQTNLGEKVRVALETPKKGKTPKVLSLSGTPYNLLGQYEGNVYTWDYVMEQKRKKEFAEDYPDEPNPYADLPEMCIYTFDLHDALPASYRFETEDMAFNFREFFRTWTGDPEQDFRPIPKDAQKGDFVHEADIISFLDLITEESEDSNYPFSKPEYRDMFRHTFWMVPGVKEARALSKLLGKHPIFKNFKVANVAGEGDKEKEYDNALKEVQSAIEKYDYTITISCGRLTMGVTVPEWSAVMMLAGSANTAASGYMQTIFRVQSVGSVDGKQKEVAYVFDFAPDRALRVLTEVNSLSPKGRRNEDDARDALGEFLNFCPVLSIEGTQMSQYDVPRLMRQIKRITVDKAIKSGFDDESIYNEGVGIVMNEDDVELFNKLAETINGQSKSKQSKKAYVNEQGLTDEEYEITEKAKNKQKKKRSPEEQELLEKRNKLNKEREKVIRLLRAVSIRLPMLIYGMDAELNEEIRMEKFVDDVDDESWEEFMPDNLTKDLFKSLLKYYDEDVVVGAGYRIRRMAKAADDLPPTKRVQRITEIFSHFRNPDKETVLTPWRVVNMHMGDMIGGYNFYEEGYPVDGYLDDPRLISRGNVTHDLISKPDVRFLEMNSKSGLYPLYLTYSIYAMKLPMAESKMPLEDTKKIWQETLENNIYVLCKTDMAVSITRRTLTGYEDDSKVNAVYLTKLLKRMENRNRIRNKLTNPTTWGKEGDRMKFDAIVGNPPYQIMDGGNRNSASPAYHLFVDTARAIEPRYISMITPSRWFAGGKGLDDFRKSMLSDHRIKRMVDYVDSSDCFPGVNIAGGVNYFLWDSKYNGKCEFTSVRGETVTTMPRDMGEYDIFIRNNESINLIRRVNESSDEKMEEYVYARNVFGIGTKEHGQAQKTDEAFITLVNSEKGNQLTLSYVGYDKIIRNHEMVGKYKVVIGRSVPRNGEVGVDPKVGYRAITTVHIFGPDTVFTDTYLMLSAFDSLDEAKNFAEYMTLKLPRFLLHETYTSMAISKENFRFVPYLDYSKKWTDPMLYERYACTEDEINMIKSMMRPLEYVVHDQN